MAAEIVVPPRRDDADESIAAFVRRRFGSEAITYIAEPLLAGIHAGDVERLSMRALFPRLPKPRQASGSVMRALGRRGTRRHRRRVSFAAGRPRRARRRHAPDAPAVSFCRYGCRVTGVSGGRRKRIHRGRRGTSHPGRPRGHSRRTRVRRLRNLFADRCRNWPSLQEDSATCSTGRSCSGISAQRLRTDGGTGFVVPRVEGLQIHGGRVDLVEVAASGSGRQALLRAFLGGARDPDVLERTDGELAETARAELTAILGIRGTPTLTRVYRWDRASPQLEVGHLKLMTEIDRRLSQSPGLFALGRRPAWHGDPGLHR